MRYALRLVLPLLLLAASSARADVLSSAPSKFAKSGDCKVHYKSLGEGRTAVVFVHGWCCDHTVWGEQATALDGKARLLFIDLPGYGKSDKPKTDYTMDLFAKGVEAVLDDAGVEHAILVGHSMGTPVVRQCYRLFPKKVKALVFVDGTLRPFTKDPAQIEGFLSRFKEATFKEDAPKYLAAMFKPDTPAAVRQHIDRLVTATSPHVAISSMRGMMDMNIWKDDAVKVSSQALMAKLPFWTEDYKRYAHQLVPNLDYREFDGVGHFLFMEKPKKFNEALVAFLRKQGVVK